MKSAHSRFAAFSGLATGALLLSGVALGQQTVPPPDIQNAKLETRAVSGSLDATFQTVVSQAGKPEWTGYEVAEVPGDRSICCGNYDNGGNAGCGVCLLERERGPKGGTTTKSGTVTLEGSRQLVVLYRLEAGQVTQIRVASQDCTLDAGGLRLVWLTGATAAQSVALLEGFVRHGNFEPHGGHELGHGALMAIALHADAAADRALESFAAPERKEELRKQAAFWMGEARAKAGFDALQRMAKSDPSPEVRAHVSFALSLSKESGAVEEMIRMAHDDASSHVRGQALFWLAQKAGKKAADAITETIENDPDTDVKEKAVFALSQLPDQQGVPKLIEVAQSNGNAEVRKRAMFWLGQSNDPRALQFFEKVLTH